MDRDKFEGICRRAGVMPVKKVTVQGVEILLAEGFQLYPLEYDRPAWCVLWATKGRGVDMTQRLYFDLGRSTQDERLNAAIETAKEFLPVSMVH